MNIQNAMKDPGSVFASPEALEMSEELTTTQKRAVLVQWHDQLQKLLVADDESMTRDDAKARASPGRNGDCLRRVTDILTRLPPTSTNSCE